MAAFLATVKRKNDKFFAHFGKFCGKWQIWPQINCFGYSTGQEKHYGEVATDLFYPFGGFWGAALLDLAKGEADRTEDQYEDLVALSGVVGWPVPVRWALVVLGRVVTVTPN